MSAADLAAILVADVGPTADPLDLAERILGSAHEVPRDAIGAAASVTHWRGRSLLLVANDVPLADVHRACGFLAARAWLRRCGVDDEEAEEAAEHVADAVAATFRAPISAVLSRLCAG